MVVPSPQVSGSMRYSRPVPMLVPPDADLRLERHRSMSVCGVSTYARAARRRFASRTSPQRRSMSVCGVSTYARAARRRFASRMSPQRRSMSVCGVSTYVCAVGRRYASQCEYLCSCCGTQICVPSSMPSYASLRSEYLCVCCGTQICVPA